MGGAAAALAGYRRQFVYSLHRALTEPSQRIKLEGREDLDVLNPDGRVREHVQVKALKKPLQLVDLLRGSGEAVEPGFLERMHDVLVADDQVVGRLASFGPIGPQLEGAWLLGDVDARNAVRTKLVKRGLSNADVERLFVRVKLERVDEQGTLDATVREIDSLEMGRAGIVFDLLLQWTYRLAEGGQEISRAGLGARLSDVGRYLAEIEGRERHWFRTIKPLDDNRLEDALDASQLREEYRAGTSARFEHILTNQDIPRDEFLHAIDDGFLRSRIVCVRGVSGQGKSTLVYRWLRDRGVTAFEVSRVEGLVHAREVALAIRAYARITGLDVYVVHDVRPGDGNWTELLVELGSAPHVQLLFTVREDDWRRSQIPASVARPHELELLFDGTEARSIFERLQASEASPRFNSFEDAWAGFRQNGPLLEFVYMLTQTGTLEQRLREQIKLLSDRGGGFVDLLRWVAQADAYGARIDAAKAADALQLGPTHRGFVIGSLEKEFLLRHDIERGQLLGLHPLRSEILTRIFDEFMALVGQNWIDSAVSILPLLIEADRSTFLLHAFSRRAEAREQLRSALANLSSSTWHGVFGVIDALLWLGVAEYAERNASLIAEVHATGEGNTWHIVLAGDFVGLHAFGVPAGPNILEDPRWVLDEARRLRCRAWRERLTDHAAILEPAREWLQHVRLPGPPGSANEWRAAADAWFWIGHLGIRLQIDSMWVVALSRDLDEVEITVLTDLVFAGHRISGRDAFASLREAILARVQQEMNLLEVAERDGAVSMRWRFSLRGILGEVYADDPIQLAQRALNEGSVRCCEVAYRLFPETERFDAQAGGHEFLALNPDPSHKAIPRENLPPSALVRFNGAIVQYATLQFRLPTWDLWVNDICIQRMLITEALKAIAMGVEAYFRASTVGDFREQGHLDLENTVAIIRELEQMTPFLFPRCAVDEWGFAAESADHRRGPSGFGPREQDLAPHAVESSVLGLARYDETRKSLSEYFSASLNFLRQGFKVLQVIPHIANLRSREQQTVRDNFLSRVLGNPDLVGLSLVNLVEAHHRLTAAARGFAEHFGHHVEPVRLRELEHDERRAFAEMVPLWAEFLRNPHHVNRQRARESISADFAENQRRMCLAIRNELVRHARRGASTPIVRTHGTSLVIVVDSTMASIDDALNWTQDVLRSSARVVGERLRSRDYSHLREVIFVPVVGNFVDRARVFTSEPTLLVKSGKADPIPVSISRLDDDLLRTLGLQGVEHSALDKLRDFRTSIVQYYLAAQNATGAADFSEQSELFVEVASRIARLVAEFLWDMDEILLRKPTPIGVEYSESITAILESVKADSGDSAVLIIAKMNALIASRLFENGSLVVLKILSP